MNSEVLHNTLNGKKILLIAPKFYHYNDEIIKKMKFYGAEVTFYYERDTSILHALIDAFFNSYIDNWAERHYNGILKKIENQQFDYLLVIHGYKIKRNFVEQVKRMSPHIETIMYQWDSRENREYIDKLPFFDKTYTFDYHDAEVLSLKYIPTFHTDELLNLPDRQLKYDLFYYGNFTQDRYERMLELQKYADQKNLRIKTHLYISWKRYLMERLKGVAIESKYVSFKKMNKSEYLDLFAESKIIVDFTTNTQTGMAMRVLDALASGKKIITNNPHIVKEPCYNPEQILIVDPDHFDIPNSFLQARTFEKQDYSIDKWLSNIFNS